MTVAGYTDVIPVTDLAQQRRYRDRPIELSAIGCTRASEAQRRGKWALLSNNQDQTVTFKTGMEDANVLPDHVIPVADERVSGRPNGGRISAVAGRMIKLDRDTPVKAGDRLIVNLPNGTAQARTVESVEGGGPGRVTIGRTPGSERTRLDDVGPFLEPQCEFLAEFRLVSTGVCPVFTTHDHRLNHDANSIVVMLAVEIKVLTCQ